jgi:asparagine synthase (glutamine-hydrolysing)
MCGILGAFVFKNSSYQIEEDYINQMRDTLIHRGPDGGRTWISGDKKVGLAHRRLSIIDLSNVASQPMSNEDDTIFVTFNGEIYNHAEIRKTLEKTGKHTFKTDHSDTEVILHAYEQWGISCIDKFRGMFAFAIWDSKKEELLLVRDRLGIKPLYYSVHDGRIVFASEIKAILKDPQQIRKVDERAMYDYLSFLVSPAPHTLFEGIKKLKCSTYLKIDKMGDVKEYKYWDMFDGTEDISKYTEKEILDRLLSELDDSVKLRKVSDVPVGVFLSGGVDSSTNAVLFSKGGQTNIKTFTIGYKGKGRHYQNENQYAKRIAKQIHAQYHERLLGVEDVIDFLPEMIRLQDEPLADPVCVSQYYVSKLARENDTIVCQIGEGADELFSGYLGWTSKRRIQQISQVKLPVGIKQFGAKMILKYGLKENNYLRERFERIAAGQPAFWGTNDVFTEKEKKELLSDRMNKTFASYTSWEAVNPVYQDFKKRAKEKSALNWMTYVDLNIRLPELLLTKVDKMGMGVSLEARVPFLDYKFVEFVMSIPTRMKLKTKEPKYLLKKAVEKLLPHDIIYRKKVGFSLPIYDWYNGELRKIMKNEIDMFIDHSDYFNKKEVNKIIRGSDKLKIWMLYNLAHWYNIYINN